MIMHKRAQTACYNSKRKHQNNILKQMKQTKQLQHLENTSPFYQYLYKSKSTLKLPYNQVRKKKIYNSPFGKQIYEIEKLKGKKKDNFSLEKDEKKICQNGWNQFNSQIQRKTISNFMDIRTQAQEIKKRQKISTIVVKSGLSVNEPQGQVFLADEKISDLWRAVKGQAMNESNFGYMKLSDLSKDIKTSLTLNNAYRLCVRSKQYKASHQQDLTDQKFKSYIYLNENAKRLPKKRYDQLMKNNYFLP